MTETKAAINHFELSSPTPLRSQARNFQGYTLLYNFKKSSVSSKFKDWKIIKGLGLSLDCGTINQGFICIISISLSSVLDSHFCVTSGIY